MFVEPARLIRNHKYPDSVAGCGESCGKPSIGIGLAPHPRFWLTPFDDACWDTGNDTMVGECAAYHGVGADNAMVAKFGAGQNFRPSANKAIMADAGTFNDQGLGEHVDSLGIKPMIVVGHHYVEAESAVLPDV